MKHQFSLLRYRNRLLLLLGVVALCGGLVACSRMASKPEPVEPTPVVPATPTVPVEIATLVEMSLRTMLLALTDPEGLVAPQTALLPADTVDLLETCPMESSGDATDNDEDNFAEDETRTFGNLRPGDPPPPECELIPVEETALPLEELSFRGSGSLVIDDKDDMDKFSGVTLEAGVKYRLSALGNPLFSITADVSLNVSPSDGAADYEIKHQGATGIAAPFSQTDLVGNYDATLTGAFAGGTVGVQGEFTFSTTPTDCETLDAALQEDCRQAVQEMETVSITPQVSTSGLIYDAAACHRTFTDGYFDVTDGAGNVLKSTYNGCAPATVTYNGQPVPPLEHTSQIDEIGVVE